MTPLPRLLLALALLPYLFGTAAHAVSVSGAPKKHCVYPERERQAAKSRLTTRIASDTRKEMSEESLRTAAVKAGPMAPTLDQSHRRNFPDPKTQPQTRRGGVYPWHFDITATYFYIGELATRNNPVPNTASSWDSQWDDNYGGYDDPDPAHRDPVTFAPKGFTPKLNPFYVALPYNDIERGGPKPEAEKVIPWYRRDKSGKYESVCRGMWVQIYYKGRYCYAQWEDCGPFVTDDWEYVFRGARPKNTSNKAAGIDISPAVRDYLGIQSGTATVHWRFVEFALVPGGPWARYGKDNPFVNAELKQAIQKYQLKNRIITTPAKKGYGQASEAKK